MITPMVDKSSGEMRRRDMLSAGIKLQTKNKRWSGRRSYRPLAAEDNFVPTN